MRNYLLIGIAIASTAAFGWLLYGKVVKRQGALVLVAREAEAKAAAQLKKAPPEIATPKPGPATEPLRLTGTLRPEAEVALGFKVPGRVTDVLVQRGQAVKAGDVVAKLDGRDLEAQAAQADAGRRAALAQRAIAADALMRARQLQEAGAATEQQVVAASGQTSAISATIDQAAAVKRYVEVIKGETRLIAPIDGVVVQAPSAPGFVVQMMSPPVVVIQHLARLKFSGHLGDRDAARVRSGMAFTATSAAGHVVRGTLDAIIPSVDPLTRRVPIEGTLPNGDGRLFAGSMVDAVIEVDAAPTLVIPATALLTGSVPAVLTVGGDGKAHQRLIKVARSDGDSLLVADGLTAADRVIARPGVDWRDGDTLPAASRP